MRKDVLKYFIDLDKEKLTRDENNAIVAPSKDVVKLRPDLQASSCRKIVKYRIAGERFFSKSEPNKYFTLKTHEMASSKMYRDLGITTPPVYYMMVNGILTKRPALISQDLYSIKQIDVALCSKLKAIKKMRLPLNKIITPYDVLYEKEIKDYCLTFMTETCYEDLISLFMLGDLRTDSDIHPDNYFLYKKQGEKKYSGVIPIDLEHSQAILSRSKTKGDFNEFVNKTEYESCLPFRHRYGENGDFGDYYLFFGTYANRIDSIKELIHSGKLSKRQLTLLKRALNYDFAGTMEDIVKYHNFDDNQKASCEQVKRLWDYNHRELGKEL